MKATRPALVCFCAMYLATAHAWAADSDVPGDFATIQAAIDDAGTGAGDTITLTLAGHVESSIHVTKAVTIAGDGVGSLDVAGGIGIYPDVDGVTIRGLTIFNGSQAIRFEIAGGTIDGTTLDNVVMSGHSSRGIEVHNSTTVTNLLVDTCSFLNNPSGLRVSSSGHLIGVSFIGCIFDGNDIGIYEANDGSSSTMSDLVVSGCLFTNHTAGQGTAIYFEEIQDALIEDNEFIDNRRDIQILKWYQASVPVSNVLIQNNTMMGTKDAVFAIFNREHDGGFDPGQTRFDGVTFTQNTATIDPDLSDNGGAVFAGAHSGPSLGGIGWETVVVSCNTFLEAHIGEGVRFFIPGVADEEALGGASLNVMDNWWGTADAVAVEALMQIPAIIDFDPFLLGEPGESCPSLMVSLDIKPQSCPNPLTVNSHGKIPVAVLGTADFDVTQIDVGSLLLEGVAPTKSALGDEATPFGDAIDDCLDCTEAGPDGFDDLLLKFKAQDLIAALGDFEDGDCLLLTLTGNLLDGTAITGVDVMIVGPNNLGED